MKKIIKASLIKFAFLFSASLFIKAGCSKDDQDTPMPLPTADEYITWQIGTSNGSLQTPTDSVYLWQNNGVSTTIAAGTSSNATSPIWFSTSFNGITTGTFSLENFYLFTNNHYYISTTTKPQITVTTYGSPGQYFIGSYSGTVKDSVQTGQSSSTYQVKGNFRIKRK